MSINIKTEPMRTALLFNKAVLFSSQRIPREDVPEGWYCYGIRGSIRHPEKPTALSDHVYVNPIGSVLSPVPLKRAETVLRRINGQFLLLGETLTLRDYCQYNNIEYPYKVQIPELRPASPEEAGLFYAQTPEKDEEMGAVGHVRIDFGRGGKGFYHTWWPRGPEELNTQEFRDELDKVVNDLRQGVLKDLPSMRQHCYGSEGAIEGGSRCQNYGFTLETERYLYRLRCNPIEGDYQAYLSCFDKQAQILSEKPVIGRITYASGESEDFTDPQEYLKAVREELPYQATTGFRCETLTDDLEIRKAVDDMVCDLYGEENPRTLEDYGNTGMTMGGMS